jgi:hypothetical protein
MANLDNPTALNLGRVGISAVDMRSTAPMLAKQPTAVDGLMDIGKVIAGGLVKEQKRKEFYSGQDRILQASLEGTQKEELQNILEEQPYYMTMLGNGATAEGAVEMASRVGAGKIFDSNMARLATGQDAEVDPDTYRQGIMSQIGAQRTGNEQVDAVFMPQMITKGQALIGTHLQKHLEHNNKQTAHHIVKESLDVISGMTSAMQAEYKDPTVTFDERTPTADLLPVTRENYKALVNSFNPATRPLNVSEEGWTALKLPLAIASMEAGNTAISKAMHEGGMYERLSPADMVKVDDAKAKGKRVNDSNNALQFLGEEAQLTTLVFKAKTVADVQAVNQKAQAIAAKYDAAGITRPDKFKDDAAIKEYSFSALREKNQFDEKMENRAYTEHEARRKEAAALQKIQMEKSLLAGQAQAFNAGIRANSLGGNPHAPVITLDGETGQRILKMPTEAERLSAYSLDKSALLAMPPEARTASLAARGIRSMEELAYKFDVVDPSVQGQLTQTLRAVMGHPTMGAEAQQAIQGLRRLKEIGDVGYVAQYLKDDTVAKNYALYDANFSATASPALAWSRSFGRVPNSPAAIETTLFNKAYKSVSKVIEEAGRHGPQVAAYIKAEAAHNLNTAVATDYEDAFRLGVESYQANSEVVGKQQMLGVPRERQIASRTGIRNPETLNNAIKMTITNQKLPNKLPVGITGYQIDYNPVAKQHYVIPHSSDDVPLFNSAFPLDYNAIKETLYKPDSAKPTTGNTLDQQIYGVWYK